MDHDVLAILDTDKWFGTLAQERKASLCEAGRVVKLSAGKRIYANGDPPDGLWAVLEGQVRLTGLPANGSEMLVRILKPGSWFGELSTLDGGERPQEALAFGATTLLHVQQSDFDQLARKDPLLYRDLALLICMNQRRALAFIALSLSSVRVRLIKALLSTAKSADGNVLTIRQSQLASIVGVSRQTVNKELKQLEGQNLIDIKYTTILVKDHSKLAKMADEFDV
jgi:CRP/FNR family transcriptional regulator, cyclic AMP receptor protein